VAWVPIHIGICPFWFDPRHDQALAGCHWSSRRVGPGTRQCFDPSLRAAGCHWRLAHQGRRYREGVAAGVSPAEGHDGLRGRRPLLRFCASLNGTGILVEQSEKGPRALRSVV
jgi:hypothetical protein